MANNIVADLTGDQSPKTEICSKHSGFTLDFVCKVCRESVCAQCVASDHSGSGHAIGCVKNQKETISELRGNLQVRGENVKFMKENLQKMKQQVLETCEEKLFSIEEDRERRRSSVIQQRNDFVRRAQSLTKCLEQEENKIYALECSSETAVSTAQEENSLYEIEEELTRCTSAQLPRVKTYNDLGLKFKRMHSVNKFSSSSSALEGQESTTFFATTSIATCSSWNQEAQPFTLTSQTKDVEATQRRDREEVNFILGEDESETLEGGMDTDEGMGAVGGLESESGEMAEVGDDEDNDANSEMDNVVLSDLARQILPDDLSPLGARLGVSTVTIRHIRFDNPRCIANAIYETLLAWKSNISADVLTEEHFEELQRCLRKIGNNLAADWLVERLQKSIGQVAAQRSSSRVDPVQPSSSPGQLDQPSSSPGQLDQYSSSGQQ